MSLTPNDRAALAMAADFLRRHNRVGLADRLLKLARSPQAAAPLLPPPPPPPPPEPPPRPLPMPVIEAPLTSETLEAAAVFLATRGQAHLAVAVRRLARAQETAQAPQVERWTAPRRMDWGDDISAVAWAVRTLPNLDIYSLFRHAEQARPSDLTAEVWRRVQVARRGRG